MNRFPLYRVDNPNDSNNYADFTSNPWLGCRRVRVGRIRADMVALVAMAALAVSGVISALILHSFDCLRAIFGL